MQYPEIDSSGELVCTRSGSDYAMMLQSVGAGNSLLIVTAPEVPSWWDEKALAWVAKPAKPSATHEWDRAAKAWRDPRTPDQIAADRLTAVRRARDSALAETDIDALRYLDALLPEPLRARRQALRDIPAAADPVAALATITGVQIEPA